jgi:non-lysosomal glucosylceramidase
MTESVFINRSGMPMGGIGAGKVDFCPNGKFTNCTASNNWDVPITGSGAGPTGDTDGGTGIHGAFMARFVESFGAEMLRTHGLGVIPPVPEETIRFNANFPYAKVDYKPLGEVSFSLEAFSALDLSESPETKYRHSSLPVALFKFTVTNLGRTARRAAVAFSWENMVGMGGYAGIVINHMDCRSCESFETQVAAGVRFYGTKPQINPRTNGEYVLQALRQQAVDISCLAGWNVDGDGRDFWNGFSQTGRLVTDANRISGGCIGFQFARLDGGALSQNVRLEPGEQRVLTFALSWYFPHLISPGLPCIDYGHAYQNWFSSAAEAGLYALNQAEELLARTLRWQEQFRASNLPEWLINKLSNDLAVLFSNSWYTKDYRFTMNESPTYMRGCAGTLDQRMASGGIMAMCFPGLAAVELREWAQQQLTDDDPFRFGLHWDCATGRFDKEIDRTGAIRHDIGWDHLEGGDLGTQGWALLHWPDLAPAFVIQVYNLALWTGDEQFLKEMVPPMKKALAFVARLDQDGDGIPDLWGPGCCTYDNENFPYYGASAYIASLYLIALRLGEKIGKRYRDLEFSAFCSERIGRVSQSLQSKLWDETQGYFRSWVDETAANWDKDLRPHASKSDNCTVAQVAGEWLAGMFGMEPGIDPGQLSRALEQIYQRNVLPVEGCPANEATSAGVTSFSWPFYVETYFACTVCYWGQPEKGLEAFRRIYHAIHEVARSPWDAPLVWEGPGNCTPGWGRWYMSNPASWFILPALAGIVFNRLDSELWLDPHIPPEIGAGKEFKDLPLFFPEGWLRFSARIGPDYREIVLQLTQSIGNRGLEFNTTVFRLPKGLNPATVQITDQKATPLIGEYDPVTGILKVATPFILRQEEGIHWLVKW